MCLLSVKGMFMNTSALPSKHIVIFNITWILGLTNILISRCVPQPHSYYHTSASIGRKIYGEAPKLNRILNIYNIKLRVKVTSDKYIGKTVERDRKVDYSWIETINYSRICYVCGIVAIYVISRSGDCLTLVR